MTSRQPFQQHRPHRPIFLLRLLDDRGPEHRIPMRQLLGMAQGPRIDIGLEGRGIGHAWMVALIKFGILVA